MRCPIYDVLTDVLATTKPDIIVTQDQCGVCAVALKDVEAAVCDVLNSDAQIVSLEPARSCQSLRDDIRAVAHALDADAAGADLIAPPTEPAWMLSKHARLDRAHRVPASSASNGPIR